MVVIDSVLRLLPGAIDAESTVDESFADGLLEYPQYTRPAEFEGAAVPEILLSGDHGAVDEWRREQALVAHDGAPAGPDRAGNVYSATRSEEPQAVRPRAPSNKRVNP